MPATASTTTCLARNQHLVWQGLRGATLHVLRGRVWVTASNRLDDHFVDAGQRLALPGRSRVVISGEWQAAISIQVPCWRPSWPVARAWTGLLRGRRGYTGRVDTRPSRLFDLLSAAFGDGAEPQRLNRSKAAQPTCLPLAR